MAIPESDPPSTDEPPTAGSRRSVVVALALAARPRQWVKNVLVFAAPGAAGVLSHHHPLELSLGAFAIFCVTASGVYLINDSIDAEADRLHPQKRHRPVAAGDLSPTLATTIGLGALAVGLAASAVLSGWQLALTIGVYAVINIAYCLGLKNEPVVDLAAVASGFVLRTIAGGVAAHVPLSDWFLIVTSFGSLFIVAGKRHAEHLDLGEDRGDHRATLSVYSLAYLRYVRAVASGIALTAYCLWAFEKAAHAASDVSISFRLSIVPVTLAILRYAFLLDRGEGGAPEEVFLSDRRLQVAGVVWVILFAIGVYGS